MKEKQEEVKIKGNLKMMRKLLKQMEARLRKQNTTRYNGKINIKK